MKTKMTNQSPRRKSFRRLQSVTIGMDLGDKTSRFCVIDKAGEVVTEGSLATTRKAISEKFAGLKHCRIAIEVGTHSPWVSRLLVELGHEVIVAVPLRKRRSKQSACFMVFMESPIYRGSVTSGGAEKSSKMNFANGTPAAKLCLINEFEYFYCTNLFFADDRSLSYRGCIIPFILNCFGYFDFMGQRTVNLAARIPNGPVTAES